MNTLPINEWHEKESDALRIARGLVAKTVLGIAVLFQGCPSKAGTQEDTTVRSEHDMIEYNNLYDRNGNNTYDQLIFWTWDVKDEKYVIDASRWVQTETRRVQQKIGNVVYDFRDEVPVSNDMIHLHKNGVYTATWNDRGTPRTTSTKNYKTTYTDYDVDCGYMEDFMWFTRKDLPRK